MRTVVTWANVYLVCFLLGFSLSAVSWLVGVLGVHVHLHHVDGHPHVHHHGFDHAASAGPSVFNFSTAMAFLAWFGGAGYLLATQFRWLTVPALVAAVPVGLFGAAIVFVFMAKVLWSPHENMQLVDYHMVGVLGRLSQPIREGGIGELVYTQGGTRKSCGARTDDGAPIEKGAEVVVTSYERGIATVKRWSDLAEQEGV